MFEDIYKVRPNVREELKGIIQDQIDLATAPSAQKGEDKRIIERFSELLDEVIDTVADLYITNFTTEELVKVIDWTTSDLGKKSAKFTMEKLNPIVIGIFNTVMKDVFDGMFDDEDPVSNLGIDGPVKCALPADGPWSDSCTLEEDCQCGCEGGDPEEDNCAY